MTTVVPHSLASSHEFNTRQTNGRGQRPANPWTRTANPNRLHPLSVPGEEPERARQRRHLDVLLLGCCCLSPAPLMVTAYCLEDPSAAPMVQVQALVRIEGRGKGGVVAWRCDQLFLRPRQRRLQRLPKLSTAALRPSEK